MHWGEINWFGEGRNSGYQELKKKWWFENCYYSFGNYTGVTKWQNKISWSDENKVIRGIQLEDVVQDLGWIKFSCYYI